MDSLPVTNQIYNDSIFRIAVHKLLDQEPGIVSWALDSIISKYPGRSATVFFADTLPTNRMYLKMNTTIIDYPKEKKVSYLWICRKLMQLLLWTKGSPAKDMSVIDDNYKITKYQISDNIKKVQQIMSEYASYPTSNPALLRAEQPLSAESSALPTYQNAISNQGSVGTSNSHSNSCNQQAESFTRTNGHAHEHHANSNTQNFKLEYCFDGSDKLQARNFVNDYDCLALRNRWSSEEKLDFFPNHLEKEALEWYISIHGSLTSWKDLKIEFMNKYIIN